MFVCYAVTIHKKNRLKHQHKEKTAGKEIDVSQLIVFKPSFFL